MKLSPKKIEILKLIANGYTDKEIAAKLKMSKRTVQTHISLIVSILNARNRTHAVALFMSVHTRWRIQ